MAEKPLSFPVVNLNGTSRKELQEQCRNAWTAIQDALEAMAKMVPHGRDYQTVSFEHYCLARDQHVARCRSLEQVKDEIMEIYESLVK